MQFVPYETIENYPRFSIVFYSVIATFLLTRVPALIESTENASDMYYGLVAGVILSIPCFYYLAYYSYTHL